VFGRRHWGASLKRGTNEWGWGRFTDGDWYLFKKETIKFRMERTTVSWFYKYKNGKALTGSTPSLYVHVRPSKTRTECKQLYECEGRNNLCCQWSVCFVSFVISIRIGEKNTCQCDQSHASSSIDRLPWFYRFVMQKPYHPCSISYCLVYIVFVCL
jgi:hypothetical protein